MKSFLLIASCFFCISLFAQNELNQEQLIQLSFVELDSLHDHTGNDFHAALAYAQALAEKTKRIHGSNDTSYGLQLLPLGMDHYYLGNYQTTIEKWTLAKDIFEANWGVEHSQYISTLANIALLHYYMGNFKISEKLNLEVKDIRAKTLGKEHEEYAFVLNNLGLLYWSTDRYEEAEGAYLESKKIMEKTIGQEHEQYANVISNLASLYYPMNRYDEIEPLYLQTKKIMAKVHGTDHPDYISCLANLAGLYVTLNQHKKAERLYLEAKTIRARTFGKKHPNYSIDIRSLGVLYMNINQLDKALTELLEAKILLEKSLGKHHPEYLIALNSLGELYLRMGRLDKAESICMEAKNSCQQVLGKRHTIYFTSLEKLAHIFIAQKAYQKAWACCFESISINSNQEDLPQVINEAWGQKLAKLNYFSNDRMENILTIIHQLLTIHSSSENLTKQLIIADLATQLLTQNRQEYIGEADQLRLLSQSASWTHRAISTLTKLPPSPQHKETAFQFAELNKSVLLYNAIQTERAYVFGGLPDSLVLQEKQLQEEKATLKATLLEQLEEEEYQSLQKDLAEVNLKLHAFKQKIKTEYPKYSQLKYQQPTISSATLKGLLNAETALLEYVVSDSFVHIFYIDQAEISMHTATITKKELTQAIHQLHDALSGYRFLAKEPQLAHQTYAQQAHWLYQQLIAPVLVGKTAIKNLIIITDGELGHLPFETFLIDDATQNHNYRDLHYLIKDYAISYAYSASLLKESQESTNTTSSSSTKQQMLALAANYRPNANSKLSHLLPAYKTLRKQLNPIKGAQKEIEMLANIFEGNFLSGEQANEQFFKQNAKDYGIIHLAMHGVLNPKNPALSALAFTENGDLEENNFLQAYEISQMDLNAKLVVLSACETGYGEFEEGNGIASLARSFMYAGVPSLIVSLWQVNDQSTEIIMESFYNYLKKGSNKAEALRLAKLDYLQKAQGISAHPAFWSPFIQLGSNDPIQLQAKSNRLWYFSIIVLCLLISGILYLKKRK